MLYFISYEIRTIGEGYPRVIGELERLGAKEVMFSQWAVRIVGMTAEKLHTHLSNFIDCDDALLVIELDGEGWAGQNLLALIHKL